MLETLAERIAASPKAKPWQPPLDYPVDRELALRDGLRKGKILLTLLALAQLRDEYDPPTNERCYFAGPPAVRYGDRIKIGTTTQAVGKRLSDLGNLVSLRSEDGGKDHEAELHARFAEYRISHEWFLLEGALARYLGVQP